MNGEKYEFMKRRFKEQYEKGEITWEVYSRCMELLEKENQRGY